MTRNSCTDRPLLVLDLDETLIHSWTEPLEHLAGAFRTGTYLTHVRPGAREFLAAAAEDWDLAIWTRAVDDYAEIVRANLFGDLPLEFVWSRERCTRVVDHERWEVVWIKDLKKVRKRGRDLSRTLIVDDTPEGLVRSYGNLVQVSPWFGETDDDELSALTRYLASLRDETDFRNIEKRGWRNVQ